MSALHSETIAWEKPQHRKALEAFQSQGLSLRGKRYGERWQLATKMFLIFTWHSELNASDVSRHGTGSLTRFRAFNTTSGAWRGLGWQAEFHWRGASAGSDCLTQNRTTVWKRPVRIIKSNQSHVSQGLKGPHLLGVWLSKKGASPGGNSEIEWSKFPWKSALVPFPTDHGQGERLFPSTEG